MIWSKRNGFELHCDIADPKLFELQTAKEILGKLFDIRTQEVDEMIRQRMEERTLYGRESAYE